MSNGTDRPSCDQCGEPRWGKNRFCKRCVLALKSEMKESGYLQRQLPRTVAHGDLPGSRHCSEGSGSWENVVRLIEEG